MEAHARGEKKKKKKSRFCLQTKKHMQTTGQIIHRLKETFG